MRERLTERREMAKETQVTRGHWNRHCVHTNVCVCMCGEMCESCIAIESDAYTMEDSIAAHTTWGDMHNNSHY